MEIFARLMVLRLSLSRVSLVVHLVSQDLSIAGKRAGLAGERSGLFMEMIRVIKEMREATNGEYPKFAIWENVPGAFSSNNGEDFRAVLEEFAHIKQPNIIISRPPKGKWSKAGAISGDGWSLAWRQLNSQYFGVAQRRKRIALIIDLGGQRAGEILFERTSLSRYPDPCIPTWQETTGAAGSRIAGNDRVVAEGAEHGHQPIVLESNQIHATVSQTGICPTLPASMGLGGGYVPMVTERKIFDARGNGGGQIVQTITGDHENRITDYMAIAIERKSFNEQSFSHYKESDKCSTLKAKAGNIGNGSECLIVEKTSIAVDVYNGAVTGNKTATLTCKNDGSSSGPLVAEKIIRWIVRRLTPVECERLQGFPDGWTDIGEWVDENGKKHKPADSPRYKSLGNSIALPQWYWICQKMKPYIGENPTLGSLFDGIGGFPLVFESTYGKGTAIWGSEIEPFCVAVTKKHFPED